MMEDKQRIARAKILMNHSDMETAIASGDLAQFQDISVSEAIVLGLLRQGVNTYIGIFGHGTTDIAEILRVYEEHGLVKTLNVRHETAAAHTATALKALTGKTAAVITSIGPGAMQAFAGSLCAASNGLGVYHIYGDETTHGEGFNMQQIPRDEQGLFLKLCSVMGNSYSVYEPWSIVTALRTGSATVFGGNFNGPFFLLAPMNVQPAILRNFNLLELPLAANPPRLLNTDEALFEKSAKLIASAKQVTIKIGQGAKGCGDLIMELANLADAAIVAGPSATGVIPYKEPRYMTVGGSKGSLAGNYAMNAADLVIVIGARAVCQWDSSGTAWKNARHIININSDPVHAAHYNRSIALTGDARKNLEKLITLMKNNGLRKKGLDSQWAVSLAEKKNQWESFKRVRYECEPLFDQKWNRTTLTEPVAIRTACVFADSIGAVKIFDAGDVQANGFQIVEDEREGQTFTDTGSSYMGFASSALLVSAMHDCYPIAFCGDGCFMMNPQILIDAVEHRARGCIIVFDNRRMAAISGLQQAQYGHEYKTDDAVEVDYVAMAQSVKGVNALFGGGSVAEFKDALEKAYAYQGLSLIHLPVYSGEDARGGMGVFGDWNVGNWCESVQAEHHRLGL
jgi:thiamine pyrophosphate-dependent acetolactate synthase large subunit-like protein